jgi:ATP-dependent Clp protease ATP-binding subunit ClpA
MLLNEFAFYLYHTDDSSIEEAEEEEQDEIVNGIKNDEDDENDEYNTDAENREEGRYDFLNDQDLNTEEKIFGNEEKKIIDGQPNPESDINKKELEPDYSKDPNNPLNFNNTKIYEPYYARKELIRESVDEIDSESESTEYFNMDDLVDDDEDDIKIDKNIKINNNNSYGTDNNSYRDNEEDEEDDGLRGPALEVFGTDLTMLASKGQIDECYGREKELFEMMEILVRRQKNNPVLVGSAGVGKTAVIELFANRIVSNLVPFVLQGRRIVSIDLARIVAGSRYRGEFELRLQKVLDEVLEQPNIIVFIDEIHNIGGTGSAEGSLDAANILKPILSRSGFQCIGATTIKEYERIEKDPALNRRFQPIRINEASVDDTINILYGLRPGLEGFHNVEILTGALRASAELSARYISDRFLPDKAIDLLDRAAAKEVIKLTNVTEGSVLSALVNSALNKIGNLKIEAYRRGDIASEFLFQEIETAYRNFLLRWVENPLSIPEKPAKLRSPISQTLVDDMRLSVLKEVDQLLFSSTKPRIKRKVFHEIKTFSGSQNQALFNFFKHCLSDKLIFPKSIYRVSLFIFEMTSCLKQTINKRYLKTSAKSVISMIKNYIKKEKVTQNNELFEPSFLIQDTLSISTLSNYGLDENSTSVKQSKYMLWFLNQVGYICYNLEFPQYLNQISKIPKNIFLKNGDLHNVDIEKEEEYFEALSELEERSIKSFKNFTKNLKPLLRKGLLQSLKQSAEIPLEQKDLTLIYDILGLSSMENNKNFLSNFDDPELIRIARQTGNFNSLKKKVGQQEIRDLLAIITGIPMQSISDEESKRLINLENVLHERVIGQEEAVNAIARAIRRSRLGIQNPNRPIASFFFCGPTGVGKTEVTKALASTLFGSENDLIRFDMSEFMEKFTITRLIGSPPGYIGYEEGGQLTDAVRRKPYAVVLFDEIEKAHPDVLNILLQILEDGRLTDSQKRLVPFDNTVVIMTSNAAAEEIQMIIKQQRQSEDLGIEPYKKKKIEPDIRKTKNNETNPIDTEILDASSIKQKENLDQNTMTKGILPYQDKKESIEYNDNYAGVINLMRSPIEESYLDDVHAKLSIYFSDSYRNYVLHKNEERNKEAFTSEEIENEKTQDHSKELKTAVLNRLTTMFLPEFLNRLDDIIIFQPLKQEELRKICNIMVNDVCKRISKNQVAVSVSEGVKNKLTREGYNPIFGARPLRRLVTKYVEDLVSDTLLKTPSFIAKEISIVLDENDNIVVANPINSKEFPSKQLKSPLLVDVI